MRRKWLTVLLAGLVFSAVPGSYASAAFSTAHAAEESLQGWFYLEDGSLCYYKDGVPLTGFRWIDGKKYRFRSKGSVCTGFRTSEAPCT